MGSLASLHGLAAVLSVDSAPQSASSGSCRRPCWRKRQSGKHVVLLGILVPLTLNVRVARGKEEPEDLELPVACACESDGKARWERLRSAAWKAFTPDFPFRLLNFTDPAHHWIRSFPCPVLPEDRFRGVLAMSDCAPGVMLLHVLCAQRKLLQLLYTDAQDHLVEALSTLPFAEKCLSPSASTRWPISAYDVHTNYVRFYRAVSYYFPTVELLGDLIWLPSWSCVDHASCEALPGHVCDDRPHVQRCVQVKSGCPENAEECPAGAVCTSLQAPSDTDCTLEVSTLCVVDGEIQAYHPHAGCLRPTKFPGMIKACSEMGTTLYPLKWSAEPFEKHQQQASGSGAVARPTEAMILPVTLRLRSPWHMLHSLVPAYAQAAMDDRYGLTGHAGEFDLLVIDQDLDKDRHIWEKVLGDSVSDTSIGGLDFLLQLVTPRPYELLAQIQGTRCYERVIWGHELMLYSGGGWTNQSHMIAFADAARRLVNIDQAAASSRLLLVERRNTSAWGRWIDNFEEVREAAEAWATEHPELLSGVENADLADLEHTEQLRLASRMRILFGAHGDGLSWAVFMGAGAVLLEAVPARDAGFQACVEGIDENPWGIFGGVARLAGLTHICWTNPQSQVRAFQSDKVDVFQWGWRQMNIHIDIEKLRKYLAVAAERAAPTI